MARVNTRPLKPVTNAEILNAVRTDASMQYQERIPVATQGNIQDTVRTLHQYRPLWNEFIDALVNRIGTVIARNISWTNPLAEFKRGMLEYGDTIEEIQVGLLKAHVYDPRREYLEKDLFGTERPEVQSNFHTVNRQEFYKVTVNEPMLHRAFLSDNGLSNFVTQLMEAPMTSDQWDEFLVTTQLFAEYEQAGGFYHVNVPDVRSLDSDGADARLALRKMRAMADTLPFISTQYNAARMPVAASRDELLLFVTPEFNAAIDVEALAGAFNVGKADMHGRVIPIPADRFGIDGVQAIMTTSDFFVIADSLLENTSQWNAAALHNNYFLHHHQVISASRFVPSVMFWTGEDDEVINVPDPVTSVSDLTVRDADGETVTDVKRGFVYEVEGYAITTPEGGTNSAVRWDVEGSTTTRTSISSTGVLTVGGDEGAEELTIRATSTWINPDQIREAGYDSTTTVTVSGDPVIDWPRDEEEPEPEEPTP